MKILEGTASDILLDFCEGKYVMIYSGDMPSRRFVDVENGAEYALSVEVNYYLDEAEFIWGIMFDEGMPDE